MTAALLPQKPVFSMREVMEILEVSRDLLESELRSGRLMCKRLGKRRIAIPYASLKTYLETPDKYEEEEKEDALPWE